MKKKKKSELITIATLPEVKEAIVREAEKDERSLSDFLHKLIIKALNIKTK